MVANNKILLPKKTVQISSTSYQVYDIIKMKDTFVNYNLIIFTTEGTFDTTNYNFIEAKESAGFESTGITGTQGGYIELGYIPDFDSSSSLPATPIKDNHFLPYGERGHKLVRIPAYSITKIVVKSKRDFFLNQGKAKKLS